MDNQVNQTFHFCLRYKKVLLRHVYRILILDIKLDGRWNTEFPYPKALLKLNYQLELVGVII